MSSWTAGWVLVVAGSVVFLLGAAIGVPRVFTTADPQERADLLAANVVRWRSAQVPYAAGPLLVAVGIGLAGRDRAWSVGLVLTVAFLSLVAGALTWTLSCAARGIHPDDFARGRLPAWPFRAYVVLTIVGLAMLGVSLLLADNLHGAGWLVLALDASFVALYAATDDFPPFLFYIVLVVVGFAAATRPV